MFAGSSLFFAMDIADIIERLKIIFMNNSSLDPVIFQQRIDNANNKTQVLEWTGEILFVFMVRLAHVQRTLFLRYDFKLILGDTVVLWRTYAIYYGKRVFVIIPFLTWLGSTRTLVFWIA